MKKFFNNILFKHKWLMFVLWYLLFIFIFWFTIVLFQSSCTSSHTEIQDVMICNGNLYHKECRVEKEEVTVCDVYNDEYEVKE